ncbi:hypothetical protein Tco_0441989 [Tanacetum coccineum]
MIVTGFFCEKLHQWSGIPVHTGDPIGSAKKRALDLRLFHDSIRTLGPEAYAMTWEVLKKKMTGTKYCPQGEIKKLEIEMWNLKFVANETRGSCKSTSCGLPGQIYGERQACQTQDIRCAIELANEIDGSETPHTRKGNQKQRSMRKKPYRNLCPMHQVHLLHHGLCNQELVGMQKKRGNAPGNPDAMSSRHRYNIDLMPVELGSFDVIIDMDWLRRCQALQWERNSVVVISCSKAQEYCKRMSGICTFICKKEEDKSEGKHIKDVPIVQDFPEVFPENLPGLPPARQWNSKIDLIQSRTR